MIKKDILEIAKPILFNTDMVVAILDDRKTKTRRIIKNPPADNMPDNHDYCNMPIFTSKGKRTLHYMDVLESYPFRQTRYFESFAKYEKDDYLYVRETWNTSCANCQMDCPCMCSSPRYRYKADMKKQTEDKWRPSIHMPKEAARIFLHVKDVCVKRLQNMTLDDFLAEGIVLRPEAFNDPENAYWQARKLFECLWNSTIPKGKLDKYGWEANPWVWVYEFKKVEVS